jgi:outer membrane protein assembly factor BamB
LAVAKGRSLAIAGLVVVSLLGTLAARSGEVGARGCGGPMAVAGPRQVETRERWRYANDDVGSFVASPLADDAILAVGYLPGCAATVHSVRVFDAATGEERWRLSGGELPVAAGDQPVGLDDAVYLTGIAFEGNDEGRRLLAALDGATGETRWIWEQEGQGPLRLIGSADGAVYLLAADDEKGALLALDAATGEERWRLAYAGHGSDGALDEATGTATAIVFGPGGVESGQVAIGVDLAGGEERWRQGSEPGVGFRIVAAGDGRLVLAVEGEGSTELRSLDPASGETTWSLALEPRVEGGSTAISAGAGTILVVGADENGDQVGLAVELASGEELWTASLGAGALGEPAITADLVVFRAGGATPGQPTELIALDRGSGEERWRADLPGLSDLRAGEAALYVTAGEAGEGQAVRALDPATGDELWNQGYPEFAALRILSLIGGMLYVEGTNEFDTALIAVDAI